MRRAVGRVRVEARPRAEAGAAMMLANRTLRLLTGLLAAAGAGCVERTARVQTRPPGALVTINDEEVGVSPVKFSFQWYGDYEIIIRKPGYETLRTHHRIDPPWYQWPPFDLVAEVLWPGMIRDEHVLPTFELTPTTQPVIAELVNRAVETRTDALSVRGELPTEKPRPRDAK